MYLDGDDKDKKGNRAFYVFKNFRNAYNNCIREGVAERVSNVKRLALAMNSAVEIDNPDNVLPPLYPEVKGKR